MGTKQVEVFRICDLCTTETRAVETNRVALNGDTYEIDCCAKHDTALNDAVMRFALKGTQIRKAQFLDKPKAPTSAVVPVRRETPVHHTELRQKREEMPQTAHRWKVTTHATERMTERGVDMYEILMAAERPQNVVPGNKPGTETRVRGDIIAIVDPQTLDILTVKRISQHDPSKRKPLAGVSR